MPDDAKLRLDWEREELILAGDLVVRNGWRQLQATELEVIELSALLRRLPIHPIERRSANFRSANSVARKTADIATNRKGHPGKPTRGGQMTKRVITELEKYPDLVCQFAKSIRQAEARGDFKSLTQPVADEDAEASEGRLLIRRHVAYERDRALRQRKLEQAKISGQPIACEVCGFDFTETYGDRGNGYIECHHIVPLYLTGPGKRRIDDLALLCANCHRMVHRTPWLTPPELQNLIHNAGKFRPDIFVSPDRQSISIGGMVKSTHSFIASSSTDISSIPPLP